MVKNGYEFFYILRFWIHQMSIEYNNYSVSSCHFSTSKHHRELLQPVFFPSPSIRRPASNLTEEEQVKIAKRIGLIQHLPIGTYDGSKKIRECVICMIDFCVDEAVRYLPCMHIYHVHCIDDWLMRSLTCPSCMEPVDAALLTSYETS
ncbi:RING finger protein 11 isoform X1 [Bactrocera oleae]|uniref:RING finger protein 11 isoform X1 n=1 Tax=Bactrocera oleae TaxID=104688 RepID=UPI00387EC2EE